ALRRAVWGGIWLGIGAGMAFLSKGILGPCALGLAVILLPLVAPAWRSRRHLLTLLAAAVAVIPWLCIWPALLYQQSPSLFNEWLSGSSMLERIVGRPWMTWPIGLGYYLSVLPWFAFPALPLAVWGVWSRRKEILARPAIILPLVVTVTTLLVLALGRTRREVFALPLLVPLAVLAIPGLLELRRGAANAFWWFSALFGSFMLAMAWFEFSALELGVPAARHRHWMRLQPGYDQSVTWPTVAAALGLTALWVWLLIRAWRSADRPLVAWSGGVCIVWAVALLMFLDYVDTGKSYRLVAMSIARHVPSHACVSSRDVGLPQRVLLDYYTGIKTARFVPGARASNCETLLVQGTRASMFQPGSGWKTVWEGARPGDRKELLRLYRRG